MLFFLAILRLTRISTSLLCSLAIFLPLLARTKNLGLSLGKAIPLLFIGMCTFIANDLHDLERDRMNHPERPLPARHLTVKFAAVLYFISLALALFSTRYFVAQEIAFWYYGLVTLSISYGYIVECLPSIKTPYVAAATSFPVMIIARSYPNETKLYFFAGSVFLLILGREICCDILDRVGDTASYLHRFKPTSLAIVAFLVQFTGLLVLVVHIRKPGEIADVVAMTFLFALVVVNWFKLERCRRAIFLMKLQLFVGLYLLA